MIASDLNNKNFAGAIEPDYVLYVQFYQGMVQNGYKSELEQRPIFDAVDMVKITTPGNQLNIVDTLVREDHKRRFPRQWNEYKNRVGEIEHVVGTPISEWPSVSRSQAEELRAIKFFTVESIAGASDAQLQGIGMIAGKSVFTLRDDARRFLTLADVDAKNAEADRKVREAEERANAEIDRVRRETSQMLLQMQEDMKQAQREQMAAFLNEFKQETASSKVDESRGPGRPPKVNDKAA